MKTILLLLTLMTPLYGSYLQQDNNSPTVHVLFLNSYHYGYRWSDQIIRGFVEEMNRSKIKLNLSIEYMDTKRHPLKKTEQLFLKLLHTKYDTFPVDFIVTSDDTAYEFALKHRKELFPNVPIIFTGVNNTKRWKKRIHNVTGVVEKVDFVGNLDLIKKISPKTSKLALIADQNPTGLLATKQFWKAANKRKAHFKYIDLTGLSAEALIEQLKNLGDDTAIFYLLFLRGEQGHILSVRESLSLIRRLHDAPIFTPWEFIIKEGATGGLVADGRLHGKQAAHIIHSISSGKNIEEINYQDSYHSSIIFNFDDIGHHKLSDLPAKTIFYGEPRSLFYTHRSLIMGVILFIITLIAFIVLLLVDKVKRDHSSSGPG